MSQQWIKTEVRGRIQNALEPVVAPAGFRLQKKKGAFVHKIDGGRQELSVALVDYNPLFRFSLTMCVRLEAIEAIKNQSLETPERYRDITVSSLTQLEFLGLPAEPGAGVQWEAQSEAQLTDVLGSVATVVGERVVPFFDEYRDLAALNRGLNPPGAENLRELIWPPDRRAFDGSNPPYRFMTGVIAAHLAGDPRLDALIASYRSQAQRLPAHERLKLEKLIVELTGHT